MGGGRGACRRLRRLGGAAEVARERDLDASLQRHAAERAEAQRLTQAQEREELQSQRGVGGWW
jgi:hypothetical protein